MPDNKRKGQRKPREQLLKRRVPELGYYFIITDTKETEQNYMFGLRDSIPKELQGKLVIKVSKTKTANLVNEAKSLHILVSFKYCPEQKDYCLKNIYVMSICVKIIHQT